MAENKKYVSWPKYILFFFWLLVHSRIFWVGKRGLGFSWRPKRVNSLNPTWIKALEGNSSFLYFLSFSPICIFYFLFIMFETQYEALIYKIYFILLKKKKK